MNTLALCPTILAQTPADYDIQMRRVVGFARRIQIDISDGVFSPIKTISLSKVWWPHTLNADIHLMVQNPEHYVDDIVRLKPNLLIVHAEADGSYLPFAKHLHDKNIKVGVALLPSTSPEVILSAIDAIDHVLIFSGDLGRFGGKADYGLLQKVKTIRRVKPQIEIGWDGGVNDHSIQKLQRGGIDVFNVGGFIQRANDPQDNYQKLQSLLH